MKVRILYFSILCQVNFLKRTIQFLINNWEATYFDFQRQKLLELADEAKKVGIELFVLDDGWFDIALMIIGL